MPLEGENLDYPPPNMYVPQRIPEACKVAREADQPIGLPVRLQESGEDGLKSDVWFK